MSLTHTEQQFLAAQRHGRLATIGLAGGPQVKPVGFTYNTELGTIDIAGHFMASSTKYRNVRANPKVAFVVDDVPFEAIDGVRFLEIRGLAETVTGPVPPDSDLSGDLIRIHPRRVLAYNIDPDRPGLLTRNIQS